MWSRDAVMHSSWNAGSVSSPSIRPESHCGPAMLQASSPLNLAISAIVDDVFRLLRASITVGALACVASISAWAQSTPGSGAQDLAQALQRRYDTIKDFSADFVHTYRGGVLRKEIVERGRLLVKNPGKMRWEDAAPDAKHVVPHGVQ